ncbi:MAG: hypothetical protein ACHQIG_12575 [Acidimicrobiia bacterium]
MSGPVVETSHGKVAGAVESGVHVFRSIPYGATRLALGDDVVAVTVRRPVPAAPDPVELREGLEALGVHFAR